MPQEEIKSTESDLLMVTFRTHHNAYKENDGSGATIIRKEKKDGWIYTVSQYFHGFILIHYFLWFIPMVFFTYLPTYFGYWWASWIILVMYFRTYYKEDELKSGRPWHWFRQHKIWELMQSYINLEIVREGKLDPKRQYIFAAHPHGIIILSRTANYGGIFEKVFPGIKEQRVLGATPMFNLPGSREICLWMSAVRADKSNAVQILSKYKLNLGLYPGGSAEIFETDGESNETVIIARKGFIRLALQHGCDLVPTFVFGEKHAYHKLNLPEKFKKFMMATLRTPLIIFWGKLYTWMPLQHDKFFLSVVYGKPIRVEKAIPEPSEQEVDELYEKFYGDVKGLYEKYKERYGYGENEKLIVREAHKEAKVQNNNAEKLHQNGHANGHVNTSSTNENGVSNGNGIANGNGVSNGNGIINGNGVGNGNGYTNGYHASNGTKNGGVKLISVH